MVELLSPAGDIECLKYAIYAGCNAIYIGGKNFGARAYAKNFNNDDIIYARHLTKIYGVKLYVTINTLIYDNEFEELTEYIRFLHKIGIDAIIVQDIGVIDYIRRKFPNLEIHASTQMNIHNENSFNILKKLGVKRIVVAREMGLKQINNINCDLEREIFIHGALCVSYSGCCLLSSYIGGRSGNRGLCAGTCRLPFTLYKNDKKIQTDGKYLLSMKDLYTLDKLPEILKSNVHSLKIEGRMKSKEYVYYVTNIYRKYIDEFYSKQQIKIDEKDVDILKSLFNREFTNGYLFDNKNNTNIKTSNNIGLYVGKVIAYNNYKCKIKCIKKVEKNDGIRIVYNNNEIGMTINRLENEGNNVITIYTNQKINVGSKVYVTSKNNLVPNIKKVKINLDIKINNKNINLNIYNEQKSINIISKDIVSKAKNIPTTNKVVEHQMKKLGNTLFEVNKINIQMPDNIFINIKDLNEFRREAIVKFEDALIENNIKFIEKDYILDNDEGSNSSKTQYSAYISNEKQFNIAINYPFSNIYVNEKIYYKYKDKHSNLVLILPRINHFDYKFNDEKLLIREVGSLKYANNNYVVSDYTLNVTNSYTYKFLKYNNVDKITLSTELNKNNINLKYKNDLEIIIYGKIELAISKYCVVSKNLNKNKGCNLCHENSFYLVDRKNSKFKLTNDKYCNSIILSNNVNNDLNLIENYKNQGINKFRFNFYDEDEEEIKNILNNIIWR